MLGIVLADDLIVLFTAWELTSITSYLLIGNQHTDPPPGPPRCRRCSSPSAGGLAMLAGFVLIGEAAGTYQHVGDPRRSAGAAPP